MSGADPNEAIRSIDNLAVAAVEATLTGQPAPLRPRHAPERPSPKPDLRRLREVYSTATDSLHRSLEMSLRENAVRRDEFQAELRKVEAKIADIDRADNAIIMAMEACERVAE